MVRTHLKKLIISTKLTPIIKTGKLQASIINKIKIKIGKPNRILTDVNLT